MAGLEDLLSTLKDAMNAATGDDLLSSPGKKIHSFLNKKSVLKSTNFLASVLYKDFKFADVWQIEDVGISFPQTDSESVGFLGNQYTMPIIKESSPIKITMTISDDEFGSIYSNLISAKMGILSKQYSGIKHVAEAADFKDHITRTTAIKLQGASHEVINDAGDRGSRFKSPNEQKVFSIDINILKGDGNTSNIGFCASKAYLVGFEEIKFSYTSLADYQKYSVTFNCDLCDFKVIDGLQSLLAPKLPGF